MTNPEMKDIDGVPLAVGQQIVYAVLRCRSAVLRKGTITKIRPETGTFTVEWVQPHKFSPKAGHVCNPLNAKVIP